MQLESEINNQLRRKHANRIGFAGVSIVRPCFRGVKFASEPTARCNVGYEIDGQLFESSEAARQWLFDRGVSVSKHVVVMAGAVGRSIGGYKIIRAGKTRRAHPSQEVKLSRLKKAGMA